MQLADVQQAIGATLPTRQGERYRKLFQLARQLKALPTLADVEARTLRPIVAEWHRRALPVIQTKPFAESWTDFVLMWGKVRFPAGQGAIEAAFAAASRCVPPPAAVALYGDDAGPLLLLSGLCQELQRAAGKEPFFLDCRTAGRLLAVPHTTAWRWLVVLRADGVIEEVEKGNQAARRASRFRYHGP